MELRSKLIETVKNHRVLTKNRWLEERAMEMTKPDLILWLKQEYFVSVAFVNWFLWTAALTNDLEAKTILVRNIWEELGEGDPEQSHVEILRTFLSELNVALSENDILPETKLYLEKMKSITNENFFSALGALGPANEYLLKLEYGKMYQSYQLLARREALPEARFFYVNLEADESHAELMFSLIESVCHTKSDAADVRHGCEEALEARCLFYEGLLKLNDPLISSK